MGEAAATLEGDGLMNKEKYYYGWKFVVLWGMILLLSGSLVAAFIYGLVHMILWVSQ